MGEQIPLSFRPRTAFGIEDFLPAASNEDALGWLERWPDWPSPALVLIGPEGAGKSHLAAIFAARTGGLLIGDHQWPEVIPDPLRAVVIDPARPVPDEQRLFDLYNRLASQGGHLLLTARVPVPRWRLALPDLASRLRAAPLVRVHPPDDELLAAVLLKLFQDRQLTVGDEVITYLVRRMERSFAAARRIVTALDKRSLEQKRPITVALARPIVEPWM